MKDKLTIYDIENIARKIFQKYKGKYKIVTYETEFGKLKINNYEN